MNQFSVLVLSSQFCSSRFSVLKVAWAVVFGAVFACCTVSAQTKPVVLKGGKVLTITHGVIENGVVVMENGKISAVGQARR